MATKNAQRDYTAKATQINAQLANIRSLLASHAGQFNKARARTGMANYGYVGDLKRVAELLAEAERALGDE